MSAVCVYLMFEVLAQYLLIILVGTNFGQNIEPLEVSTRVTNSVRPKQNQARVDMFINEDCHCKI